MFGTISGILLALVIGAVLVANFRVIGTAICAVGLIIVVLMQLSG